VTDPEIEWEPLHEETDTTYDRGGAEPAASVLVFYTGGTIGAVPKDPKDPKSPLRIANWAEFNKGVAALDDLRREGVRIDALALVDPLDSTNVEPKYWTEFVRQIVAHMESYDGFVLLHGTDTMVYTASALSFMLVGLAKPVVLTGSQIPILKHPHTDGTRNLANAIRIAGYKAFDHPPVPEVTIAFDKVLLRGNRTRKIEADGLGGFDSPSFQPLAEFQDGVKVFTERIWKGNNFAPLLGLEPDVLGFKIFPGIQSGAAFGALLSNEHLKGLVLEAYGSGNAPSHEGFLELLKDATGRVRPMTIIDVTQCVQGTVRLGQYETGVGMLESGVISGADLTPEAALCKLMVLLGNRARVRDFEQKLQTSVAGEQSEGIHAIDLVPEHATGSGEVTLRDTEGGRLDLITNLAEASDGSWQRKDVASVWLHLYGATLTAPEVKAQPGDEPEDKLSAPVDLEVHTNPVGALSTDAMSYITTVTKSGYEVGANTPELMTLQLRGAADKLTDPPNISLVLRSPGMLTFEKARLVVVVNERVQRHG